MNGSSRRGARPRVLVSWSSGKDSAWALHVLTSRAEVEVAGLLTTVTSPFERVSMHGVRRELLREQARSLGLPLHEIEIPSPCSNADYERAMGEAMRRALADGVEAVAFGDLFLEDVRRYREERLAQVGMGALFPLWGSPTGELARAMIAGGTRARVVCVDPRTCPREVAGAEWDAALLDALPPEVDPCGENGELHTFVTHAPGFARPVEVVVGETVERDGFVFTDLTPAEQASDA